MTDEGRAQVSLAEEAYRRIEEMIVTRVLKAGAMISEKRLAEEVGCGRTPVREALQRLKLEGYIEIHPSRGIQVSSLDLFRQFELLEVRRPLEDLMVKLAAERATASERIQLGELVERLETAASGKVRASYLDANRSIHETLANATRNSILANSIGVLHGLSRKFWYGYIEDEDVFETAARLHGRTVHAVIARDPHGASNHAADFLSFLEKLTRKALNDRTRSG